MGLCKAGETGVVGCISRTSFIDLIGQRPVGRPADLRVKEQLHVTYGLPEGFKTAVLIIDHIVKNVAEKPRLGTGAETRARSSTASIFLTGF
jgi:hypothetical protein